MHPYILKQSAIESESGLSKSHFLNHNAQRVNKSLGDLTGLTGLGVHLIEVQPGRESTEYHMHYYEDECTYVLSGSGKVTIGEDDFDIAAGDFIAYPKGGQAHTMINTGKEVLKCLVIGERLAHDVGDYPRQNKRIFRNKGQAWNLVDIESISEPKAGAKTKN
ncbi:MAG: cupin domain-containing protein [Granulosicoccus sp.]|nr:cupin domain-containing protein [Granulosicoccus sp.]